jgi:hypothetical protein
MGINLLFTIHFIKGDAHYSPVSSITKMIYVLAEKPPGSN